MEQTAPLAQPRHGKRLWRIVAWLGIAVSAALALASGVGWLGFRQVADDLRQAHQRLPSSVASALSPTLTTSSPVTVLVSSSGGLPEAVVLRLDPRAHTARIVNVNPGVRVGGLRLGSLTTTSDTLRLIEALSRAGLRVNHVLLLDPARIAALVDGLGGVSVSNQIGGRLVDTSGREYALRRGTMRLDGRLADAYFYGVVAGRSSSTPRSRRLAVLDAIAAATFEPPSFNATTPDQLAGAVGRNTATDISATGIVDAWRAWGGVDHASTCVAASAPAAATACDTVQVSPPPAAARLALLGANPSGMLALIFGLAMFAAGVLALGLEVTGPGFRALRHRSSTVDSLDDTAPAFPASERPARSPSPHAARPPGRVRPFGLHHRMASGAGRGLVSNALLLAVAVGFGFLIAHAFAG